MILIPAIDLLAGQCVRLKQGQFNQVTEFNYSPVERAAYFAQLGAQRLHAVDLDGAQTGTMQQLALISSMQNTGIQIQAGGGIRTLEQAKICVAAGITQLVLGSVAISDRDLTTQIIEAILPENIILAIDVRIKDGIPIPATHGWQADSENNLWEVVSYYQQFGINQILCTDIACDGMMQGPSFDLYLEARERFPEIKWQASGGIRHEEDLVALEKMGVAGAILGLALYKETLDLGRLLSCGVWS